MALKNSQLFLSTWTAQEQLAIFQQNLYWYIFTYCLTVLPDGD